MEDLPSSRVIAIPEILCLIIRTLDVPTLRTSALVCKAWQHYARQILWRQLVIPKDWFSHDLTPLWPILEQQGDVVKTLTLELWPVTRIKPLQDAELVQSQLASLLSRMPNLESLNAQVPRDLHSKVVRTVAEHAKQLKEFETDILNWEPEDMTTLLVACPNIRMIAGHRFSGEILKAIANSQPQLKRIDCTHPTFDDNDLIAFVEKFPNLAQLCVSMHQDLSTKALVAIAQNCHKIEHLGFHFCLGLQSLGFQAIFSVSPRLRILDLGPSDVRDPDIALVAAQCPLLETLKLPFCSNITHQSILAIVQSCRHLKHLDISWCDSVLLSIFNTAAPWVCEGLQYLDISGIHAMFCDGSDPGSLPSALLPLMYEQLSRFVQLRHLKLSGHSFPIRLLDVGRPYMIKLSQLETLDVAKLKNPIPWKDMIEIGNWFPRLRELQFRSSDVISPLSVIHMTTIEGSSKGYKQSKPLPMDIVGSEAEATGSGSVDPSSTSTSTSTTTLPTTTETNETLNNTDSSPIQPPPKRKRSRSPSPSPSSSPKSPAKEPSDTTSSSTETAVSNPTDSKKASAQFGDDHFVVEDGVVKAKLLSGLEISFRISGDDDEGSGDDTPFSGGFGGKPF
ncbi:hypothetical protein B0O80DRAFT_63378 [Mortierella sp. GBAus27b]|nr:F-box protein of unknown function [Mortierella sp. GBA43]KAI8353803.1 hypothetical protein B0O80DRAFT_63378 [Mortierella sp. GBAus27b]